jgi:hypothetical protein
LRIGRADAHPGYEETCQNPCEYPLSFPGHWKSP